MLYRYYASFIPVPGVRGDGWAWETTGIEGPTPPLRLALRCSPRSAHEMKPKGEREVVSGRTAADVLSCKTLRGSVAIEGEVQAKGGGPKAGSSGGEWGDRRPRWDPGQAPEPAPTRFLRGSELFGDLCSDAPCQLTEQSPCAATSVCRRSGLCLCAGRICTPRSPASWDRRPRAPCRARDARYTS